MSAGLEVSAKGVERAAEATGEQIEGWQPIQWPAVSKTFGKTAPPKNPDFMTQAQVLLLRFLSTRMMICFNFRQLLNNPVKDCR